MACCGLCVETNSVLETFGALRLGVLYTWSSHFKPELWAALLENLIEG